jgi:hypothetical protein
VLVGHRTFGRSQRGGFVAKTHVGQREIPNEDKIFRLFFDERFQFAARLSPTLLGGSMVAGLSPDDVVPADPDSLTVARCPVSRPPDVIGPPDVIPGAMRVIRPIANLDRDDAWGCDIARRTGITGSVWAITRVTGSVCRRTSDRPRGPAGGRNLLRGCRRCHSGWFLGAANEEKWGERQYINTYSHISLLAKDSFCTRRLALFELAACAAIEFEDKAVTQKAERRLVL